jgi:hypothetical protein
MAWWSNRPSLTRPAEPVIVSTQSGQSIKGVSIVIGSEGMVLTAAKVAGVGQNNTVVWNALLGEVVIPASNIDYWQRAIGQEMVE